MPEPRGRVLLEATVSPSEDPEKVVDAVRNVAGGAHGDNEEVGRKVTLSYADVGSLRHLRDQLRDRHIRSAARRLLLRGKRGNKTVLMLNRQAASAGVLAVCGAPEESPLGPIYLIIISTELDKVIDWLAAYEDG
ncbi:MAG: hypothetical protein OK404_01365 [Thaumarchaeota archaeon]|nr:hypothetical protein [Nitrososphaerota archaeon]